MGFIQPSRKWHNVIPHQFKTGTAHSPNLSEAVQTIRNIHLGLPRGLRDSILAVNDEFFISFQR